MNSTMLEHLYLAEERDSERRGFFANLRRRPHLTALRRLIVRLSGMVRGRV